MTMRTSATFMIVAILSAPLLGQTRRVPPPPSNMLAGTAESAIKQAMDQLGNEKKNYERELEALQRLRNADVALTDPMQPHNAIQKACDEVDAAKGLVADFLVKQGVTKVSEQLDDARRSPMSADFGRLRAGLRADALGPQIRVVARNGAKLQEDTLAWIRVQELISMHLKSLAEITSASLRAAQQ